MSCPFYNAELRVEDRGMGRVTNHLVTGPGLNNRCALITSVRSPCWMEVGESRLPDWAACPRNPEYPAHAFADFAGDPNERLRFSDCVSFLVELQRARSAREDATRKVGG